MIQRLLTSARDRLWPHQLAEQAVKAVIRPPHKSEFFAELRTAASVLEIGPFDRPYANRKSAPQARIVYSDYMTTEQLRQRAAKLPDRDPAGVPEITYVASGKLDDLISERFDYVVTSHMAEHSPDFVGHLNEIATLLNPGGTYLCFLPDKRGCFDHFIPESTLSAVIAAHAERRQKPTLQSFIEHRAFTVHQFDSVASPFEQPPQRSRIESAIAEYYSVEYPDAHCWQFTPESVARIVGQLVELGYIRAPTSISFTAFGPEFGLRLQW